MRGDDGEHAAVRAQPPRLACVPLPTVYTKWPSHRPPSLASRPAACLYLFTFRPPQQARDLTSGEMVALKLYRRDRLNAVSAHQAWAPSFVPVRLGGGAASGPTPVPACLLQSPQKSSPLASPLYTGLTLPKPTTVQPQAAHPSRQRPTPQVEREVRLHVGLCHENIVALHAAFSEGPYTVLVQEARRHPGEGGTWRGGQAGHAAG